MANSYIQMPLDGGGKSAQTFSNLINGTLVQSQTATIVDALGIAISALLNGAVPQSALLVAGSDGTNLRALKTDSSGALSVNVSGTVPVSQSTIPWSTQQYLETAGRLISSVVSVSSSGNNVLIAGVTNQTIRVYRLMLVLASSNTLTFQDGSSTALTGALALNAGATIVLDFEGEPWFITSTGNGFVLNLSSANAVSGNIYYTQS
jgi:hypothetical protein